MRVSRALYYLTLIFIASLHPWAALAQSNYSVGPLQTTSVNVLLPTGITAADTTIPVANIAGTTLFRVGNVIKIETEYLLINVVTLSMQDNPGAPGFTGYSTLTVSRGQQGSSAAAHALNTPILRVFQLEVNLASPNVAIGAYQLDVNYNSNLSLAAVNVFPGDGPLGTPVAVNTNVPGVVTLNSFNAANFFQGLSTAVARLYFTGISPGPASVSLTLANLADATGTDLDVGAPPSGVNTTLSAMSLTVTTLDVIVRRIRGQITSQ